MAGKGSIVFGSDVTGLKKATSELLKMADEAKRTGAALAYADKEELAFNKSLGSMTTVAKSVSGKMSELSTSIKELTVHYRSLSDQEKSSPYGKTLQASIQQLQGRFKELKGGVDEATKGMQTGGGIVDKLTSVLGVGSSALLKFAGGFGVAMSAGEAFNQVMRASQTTSDAYDNIQRGLTNTISVFSTALATCDFSVMENGLVSIMRKAADTQVVFDQLGNAIMSMSYIETGANEKVARARAVLYDPAATKKEKQQAMVEIKAANKELKEAAAVVAEDVRSYIKARVSDKSLLSPENVSMGSVDKILKLDATKGRDYTKNYYSQQYYEFLHKKSELDKVGGKPKSYNVAMGMAFSGGSAAGGTMSAQEYNSRLQALTKQYEPALVYQEVLRKNNDDWAKDLGAWMNKYKHLQQQSQSGIMGVGGRTISRLNNQLSSSTSSKGRTSIAGSTATSAPKIEWDNLLYTGDWEGVGEGYNIPLTFTVDTPDLSSVDSQVRLLQERMQHTTSPTTYSQLNQRAEGLKTYAERFKSGQLDENGIYNPLQSFQGVKPVIAPQNEKKKQDNNNNNNNGKQGSFKATELTDGLSGIGSGVQQLYNAFGATVPEGLQKVLSTLTVISTLIGIIQSILAVIEALQISDAASNWIPFLANGGYIPKFAGGGTVGGTSYAGDHILARLNSGEAVLNSEQAGNILTQLADSKGNGGGGGVFVLRGEDIYTSMNNFGKRTGRGELVFSRR